MISTWLFLKLFFPKMDSGGGAGESYRQLMLELEMIWERCILNFALISKIYSLKKYLFLSTRERERENEYGNLLSVGSLPK